jgi:hypothetical protein
MGNAKIIGIEGFCKKFARGSPFYGRAAQTDTEVVKGGESQNELPLVMQSVELSVRMTTMKWVKRIEEVTTKNVEM